MRGMISMSMLTAASLALPGCSGKEAATAPKEAVVAESSLVAIWRTSMATPFGTVDITMDVSGDHTLSVSVKAPATADAGAPMVESRLEYSTWSLNSDVMTSDKTTCKYADATGQLQEQACRPPLRETSPVSVNGKNLTVLNGDATVVFTRD